MTSIDWTAPPFATSAGAHSAGWVASLVLHAMLAFGAVVFTQQITLAPQNIPFKWDVAMVEPAAPEATNPSAVSAPTSASTATKRLLPTPVPHTSPPPTSPSQSETTFLEAPKQDTSVVKSVPPNQASRASPEAIEPVAQEGTAVQTAPTESSPVSTRQHFDSQSESHPVNHESPTSLATPLPKISDQPQVSEPAVTTNSTVPIVGQTSPALSTEPESSMEQQVVAMAPIPSASGRPDYSWLKDTILRRVEELKRYPAEARLDRAEGKVVLKVVIRSDGSVDEVEVYQSSGYQSLDHSAVELLRRAAPFQLPRPLGKSQMTVKIPMSYRLDQ
jgi:periplasmic protein TonB